MALTYSDYIQLKGLLELQRPHSTPAQHDEMLFIIIHQTYELWFKLLLHEFEKAGRDFEANDLWSAIATFKRARTVMKVLVEQMDILETMTPLSFNAFRDRLETASGFQSYQFRELEFALGMKRPETLKYYQGMPDALTALEARLRKPSVIDHFYRFLAQQGARVPEELLKKDPAAPNLPSQQLQDELVALFRSRPDVMTLLELMTDFDEGFQEWRYRHVKIVERTIGFKHGTGGSYGVPFLKESLFKPVFPDLWLIRSRF